MPGAERAEEIGRRVGNKGDQSTRRRVRGESQFRVDPFDTQRDLSLRRIPPGRLLPRLVSLDRHHDSALMGGRRDHAAGRRTPGFARDLGGGCVPHGPGRRLDLSKQIEELAHTANEVAAGDLIGQDVGE